MNLQKPGGIIALLDEACMFPKSTHETFAQKLYQTFNKHPRFIKPKLSRSDFIISHYAGEEKNCRRGRFSLTKLKGKRVIELGAGCGVAGFESIGSITAAELRWGNEDHIRALDPPFDYIIGNDVVYAEHLLEPLLQTMLALSGPKTMILIGYEIRSTNVHDQMLQLWKKHFEVKIVPKSKMDIKYQHPSIQLYMMRLKTPEGSANLDPIIENVTNEKTEDDTSSRIESVTNDADNVIPTEPHHGNLSDWEARRYGSMAARLLRDIKIT